MAKKTDYTLIYLATDDLWYLEHDRSPYRAGEDDLGNEEMQPGTYGTFGPFATHPKAKAFKGRLPDLFSRHKKLVNRSGKIAPPRGVGTDPKAVRYRRLDGTTFGNTSHPHPILASEGLVKSAVASLSPPTGINPRRSPMGKTLTATDRKSLIRLASTMAVGSPERRAILAGLKKVKAATNYDREILALIHEDRRVKSGWEREVSKAYRTLDNAGDGYGVGDETDDIASIGEAGRLIDTVENGQIAVYWNPRHLTLVADKSGPWAVDVSL